MQCQSQSFSWANLVSLASRAAYLQFANTQLTRLLRNINLNDNKGSLTSFSFLVQKRKEKKTLMNRGLMITERTVQRFNTESKTTFLTTRLY